MRWALVGMAGALGALSRFGIGQAVGVRSFPWATLGINLAGSLALGLVLSAGSDRWSETSTIAVATGFLGAFTTFSTFSFETQALLRDDRAGAALAYLSITLVAGVAAAAAGYGIGRLATT